MTFTRYELTLDLELVSELHIGGVDEVPERDGEGTLIRFCRNGLGEPTIPGRSLRGGIRAACDAVREQMSQTCDAETEEGLVLGNEVWKSLWGDETAHTGKNRGEIGLPQDAALPIRRSALTFHAVSFPGFQNAELPTRHGVGIDRTTGAASSGALYEHEFLPRGTRFTAVITAEGRDNEKMTREQSKGIPSPASTDAVEKLLGLIVSILDSGAVALGGRTGSGQGTVRLHSSDRRLVTWTTDAARREIACVVDALVGKEEDPPEEGKGNKEDKDRKQQNTDDKGEAWPIDKPVRVAITWWSPTGVFVAEDEKLTKQRKAEAEAKKKAQHRGQDPCEEKVPEVVEPLRDPSQPWEHAQLLIPGTSIRGALRSRASRIARTVLASRSQLSPYATHDIHEQIAHEPNLVRYLFGTTEYRGAVTVHDCLSTELGTRIEVTHNAIDRWTGGVIDGGLFTEAIYPHAQWNDIEIEVDARRLLRNVRNSCSKISLPEEEFQARARASWCLLCLALAELSAGTLPLGSRSTRGLGQVEVTGVSVSGADDVIISAPINEKLWPSEQVEGTNAPQSAAHALLAYLRGEPDGREGYTGWAEYLQEPAAATSGVSAGVEGENQ